MKTKLISMLIACIMFVSLAACSNDNSGDTPDESTKETDMQATENVTTEDTTEEDTTEPVADLALNEDLLSDIGLTYPKLVEKRGEKVEAKFTKLEGSGLEYTFANGLGAYAWGYDDLDYGREIMPGEWQHYSEINEAGHLPKSDAPCKFILTEAKNLFVNASFPINVANVKNIDGIENYRTGEDGISTPFNYYSGFFYNGVGVSVCYDDIETIEATSYVEIYCP